MKYGIYGAAVHQVEGNRLRDVHYPHEVSCAILEPLSFSSLLDGGAGPDTKLAAYVVRERNAHYVACDMGRTKEGSFAAVMRGSLTQQGIDARVFEADLRCLPPEIGVVDVAHARFVLMHLPDPDRRKVIQQLLKVSTRFVILLEYNWRTLRSTRHTGIFNQFLDACFALAPYLEVDYFAGETLRKLVPELVDTGAVTFSSFQREEGDHTPELIQACGLHADLARIVNRADLASTFVDITNQLQRSPIAFVQAEIVAALIAL